MDMHSNDDAAGPVFPGSVPSRLLRALALAGIMVPLAVLLPAWWGRPSLDLFSLVSYLACAAAPVPFGAWIGEAFGDFPKARNIMAGGLVLAIVAAAAGYWMLMAGGKAAGSPPETLLVVPLAQLGIVLVTAFAAWTFGRS